MNSDEREKARERRKERKKAIKLQNESPIKISMSEALRRVRGESEIIPVGNSSMRAPRTG